MDSRCLFSRQFQQAAHYANHHARHREHEFLEPAGNKPFASRIGISNCIVSYLTLWKCFHNSQNTKEQIISPLKPHHQMNRLARCELSAFLMAKKVNGANSHKDEHLIPQNVSKPADSKFGRAIRRVSDKACRNSEIIYNCKFTLPNRYSAPRILTTALFTTKFHLRRS
jgi:hypothetical protein